MNWRNIIKKGGPKSPPPPHWNVREKDMKLHRWNNKIKLHRNVLLTYSDSCYEGWFYIPVPSKQTATEWIVHVCFSLHPKANLTLQACSINFRDVSNQLDLTLFICEGTKSSCGRMRWEQFKNQKNYWNPIKFTSKSSSITIYSLTVVFKKMMPEGTCGYYITWLVVGCIVFNLLSL